MAIIWPASLTEGVKVKVMETRGKKGKFAGRRQWPSCNEGSRREAVFRSTPGGTSQRKSITGLVGLHLSVVPVETGEPH